MANINNKLIIFIYDFNIFLTVNLKLNEYNPSRT